MTTGCCASLRQRRSFSAPDRACRRRNSLLAFRQILGGYRREYAHLMLPNRRRLLAGAVATTATVAAPAILRAQGGPLKVGVLLPRSGVRGRHRPGLPARRRHRARRAQGARHARADHHERRHRVERRYRPRARRKADQRRRAALIGAFDSGQTTAIAQVAEQKGIPLVINIASATQITEQGYKFVVRNFPTASMLLNDELSARRRSSRLPAWRRRRRCSCTSTTCSAPACRKASTPCCRNTICPTRSPTRFPTIRRRATFRSK